MIALIKISNDDIDIVAGFFDIVDLFSLATPRVDCSASSSRLRREFAFEIDAKPRRRRPRKRKRPATLENDADVNRLSSTFNLLSSRSISTITARIEDRLERRMERKEESIANNMRISRYRIEPISFAIMVFSTQSKKHEDIA